MMRCATCTRWWSIGPSDAATCACGGVLVAVDMKAHIAALPDGTKVAHNHQAIGRRPIGECPACDHEIAAEQKAKQIPSQIPNAEAVPKP